jgi:hypothetical protein
MGRVTRQATKDVSLRAEATRYLRSQISICDEPAGGHFPVGADCQYPSDRDFSLTCD